MERQKKDGGKCQQFPTTPLKPLVTEARLKTVLELVVQLSV
jgi:hypothetical protein